MVLRQYLENHYPELVGGVTGGMYPPPQNALVLAQVMQMVQFIIIPFMFFGDSVLEMFGNYATTGVVQSVPREQDDRIYVCLDRQQYSTEHVLHWGL